MTDTSPQSSPLLRRRIGELLLDEGLITTAQLQEALAGGAVVDGRRDRLGQTIVRLGFASEEAVARALARQLRLEFVEGGIVVDEGVATLVPAAVAERTQVLPLRNEPDGTLVVVCADPTNVVALDDVRLASGARRVRPVVAPASLLEVALRKAYGFDQRAGELIDAIDADRAGDTAELDQLAVDDDAPVIRLAEGIIGDAVDTRASDIHVEPAQFETVVRYRTDGVLHKVMTVPRSATGPLISRLKLMAGMDIAERRRPQDGRARFKSRGGEVDLRVSSLASLHGETIVIRLLRKGAERLSVGDVGFTPEQVAQVLPIVERPQGLVLITGPTGSGKTSTLYGFLGHLAGEDRNIITIEDPVEYELPGVNQTQINERIGFTFAKALRTVLRQDPDVVMLGEIRDPETAELALQASLTGHLVLSTLHTNDAPSAIVRLRDLGVPPYLIASSLSLVMAQRLARNVCKQCAVARPPRERLMAQLHLSPRDVELGSYRGGAGCPTCNHTGYHGRTGIFEVLTVDGAVREHVATQAAESALRTAARLSGLRNLREDALAKAAAGITTLEEVLRVTTTDVSDAGACPVCAQHVEDDFALCPWCGADLRPEACASCNRHLERGWRVCPTCGTPTHHDATPGEDRPPRLLVVDDDPSVPAAIAAMLTGDYDVAAVDSGKAALEAVHRERPDAVLLDVGLPDQDGYAVTRELRARPVTVNLPIVLMTGMDDPATELEGLRAGADDHVTKPLDLEVLLARLEAVRRRLAT
ncbi:MAG: ATPase, T2SS/T4P/T4SS family [Egibacteraceae bacterium]